MRQHLVGDASKQDSRDAAAAVRCHHDRVAVLFFRRLDDGLVGLILLDLNDVARHASLLRGFGRLAEHLARVLLDLLRMLRKCFRHAVGARCGDVEDVEGLLDGDHRDLCANGFREPNSVSDSFVREFGTVGGDQDLAIHGNLLLDGHLCCREPLPDH